MKYILLLIALISISCNQINQNSESDSRQSDSLKSDTQNFAIPTTALPLEPLKIFPTSFVPDSTFIEDTTFNFTSIVYFLKSNEDDELNKSMKQFIQHEVDLEKPENKTSDQSSFEMWVTNITISENLICILFRKQTFTEGAAHYNHEFLTFNYDIMKKKRILFTDVFKFSKSKSKQSFCNELNGYLNGMEASDGYRDGLTPKEIKKDLNYAVLDKQLIVYPNYCCADESKTFTVDLQLIKDYIDPVLAKDYGLIYPGKRTNR